MGEFFGLQGLGGPQTAVLHFSRRQKTRENRLEYQAEKKLDLQTQSKGLMHTNKGRCKMLWIAFPFQYLYLGTTLLPEVLWI